jgi:hypothetical protein
MANQSKSVVVVLALLILSACAATKGAAVGAGIGALAGDAGKGAAVGAVVDIID